MINVVGLGYVGLPTALMMASHGIEILGTDCNERLINNLAGKKARFNERGMDCIYQSAMDNGIRFSTDCHKADAYIIAVPTPYNKETGTIDTDYLLSAFSRIMSVCETGATVIVESTVTPGTLDNLLRPLLKPGVHLAHAPERVLPSNIVYELQHNNRTIGADSPIIGEKVRSYYKTFCAGEILVTDIRTAEMSKVVENAFRAVNIAFANELSRICHQANMDVNELIRVCNMHPRVQILNPGAGVGGHCIGVDPWFLVEGFPKHAQLTMKALTVNEDQPRYILSRIMKIMEENAISDMNRVGLYGLTYKEDVDDIRNSPALQLLNCLKIENRPMMKSYDPLVHSSIVDNQMYNFNSFLNDIDLVVILVKHKHILSNVDKLKGKKLFDCTNAICTFQNNFYRL